MGFWDYADYVMPGLNLNEPGLNVAHQLYDKTTGQGAYAPVDTKQLQTDNDKTRALAQQFTDAYGNTAPTQAPTMQAATIDTTQSDQARGIQQGGLGTTQAGVNLQKAGAGIQGQGLDYQRQGIGTQQSALDVARQGVGVQQEGIGAQRQALGTAGEAAQSYRDVLSGKAPSLAEMTGRKLASEAAAGMYGGAAGASGANRTLALRTAINGAGAIGARAAADAATARVAEQDQARAGLLGAGNAQSGIGSQITGAGSQIAGTGQGIAGIGQGITAGGQGISATGQGLSNTGAGLVNSGVAQSGIGTSIRGQDIDLATGQAQLNQGAGQSNLAAAVANRGQDIAQENNRGNLALGATNSVTNADTNQINQIRQNNQDQQKNNNDTFSTLGNIFVAASDKRAKTDVEPAQPSQISNLFRSVVGSSVDDMAPQSQRMRMASDERTKSGKSNGTEAAREMFMAIVPKTFKYKPGALDSAGMEDPATESPRHLGVMAQDVEQSGKLGRGIVKNQNGTKVLDIPMTVSALMAAVADIERRLGSKSARG